MKHFSLNKTLFFIALFIASVSVKASDTLKVKKVRFFVEPKIVSDIHIPVNKTTTFNGYDDGGYFSSHGGYFTTKTISQNKPILNLGLSAGLSVKLGKHFFYELSLSYYHYSLSSKLTRTSWYLSGSPDMRSETDTYKASYNYIGLGNGISYRNKRFSLINTLLFYQYITYKEAYIRQDNISNWQQSYISSGNAIKTGDVIDNGLALMSEHKIGYSFLNNRIVPFIGINFNLSSTINSVPFKAIWLPFASVKINF